MQRTIFLTFESLVCMPLLSFYGIPTDFLILFIVSKLLMIYLPLTQCKKNNHKIRNKGCNYWSKVILCFLAKIKNFPGSYFLH